MAESNDIVRVRLTVLTKSSDYQSWKLDMQLYLEGKGWFGHIDDDDPRPSGPRTLFRDTIINTTSRETSIDPTTPASTSSTSTPINDDRKWAYEPDRTLEDKRWDETDAKGIGFLLSHLSMAYKLQFRRYYTMKSLWLAIKKILEPMGPTNKITSLSDLITLTLKQCQSLQDYVNRFTKRSDDLIIAQGSDTASNLTQDILIGLFILGINTDKFRQFVLSIRTRPNLSTLRLDDVMQQALEEDRILSRTTQSHDYEPAFITTKKSKSQHQSKTSPNQKTANTAVQKDCTHHGINCGHTDSNCYTQHPELRPKNNTSNRYTKPTDNDDTAPKRNLVAVKNPTKNTALHVGYKKATWALDTGASNHYCNDLGLLSNVRRLNNPFEVGTASGPDLVEYEGESHQIWYNDKGQPCHIVLNKVAFLPKSPVNLVSASILRRKGLYFSNLDDTLRDCKTHDIVTYAPVDNTSINIISGDQIWPEQETALYVTVALPVLTTPKLTPKLWHQRTGHTA